MFIDGAVDSFLRGVGEIETTMTLKPQIVLFGAGYDTRSLRCNGRATFFEVDCPTPRARGDCSGVLEGYGGQVRWKRGHHAEVVRL